MSAIMVTRAGPLCTIQDAGRFGMLGHGISASGPMDRAGFALAGSMLSAAGTAAIEFTAAGIGFTVEGGQLRAAAAGGAFRLAVNGNARKWPARLRLEPGDHVEITPGPAGNYGYLRFDREVDVPPVMGSRATNSVAKLGGLEGRALKAGDRIGLFEGGAKVAATTPAPLDGPIRVLWGLHADLFDPVTRGQFVVRRFTVSSRIDRMGARLTDLTKVFGETPPRSLISHPVVPGDIQILGDGTPIVLLRDHQPTGGYPRIATVISADLDRFAQLRPGTEVTFSPVTLQKALAAGWSRNT